MKKIAIFLAATCLSISALAGEVLNCGLATTTTNPNNYDKQIFYGAVERGEFIFVKPNGEVLKKKSTEFTFEDLKSLDKSLAVSASIQDNDIVMSLGIWSSDKTGPADNTLSMNDAVIASKSDRAVLMSGSKNLAVMCKVEVK